MAQLQQDRGRGKVKRRRCEDLTSQISQEPLSSLLSEEVRVGFLTPEDEEGIEFGCLISQASVFWPS